MTKIIGSAIRTIRKEKGLSGKELVARIKAMPKMEGEKSLTQPQLSNIESGLSEPLFATVLKIASALGVSILDISAIVLHEERLVQQKLYEENKNRNSRQIVSFIEKNGINASL